MKNLVETSFDKVKVQAMFFYNGKPFYKIWTRKYNYKENGENKSRDFNAIQAIEHSGYMFESHEVVETNKDNVLV